MNAERTWSARFSVHVGDSVLLRAGHPWGGYKGKVVGFEVWLGRDTLVVELDNGIRAGVLYPNDIEIRFPKETTDGV